MTQPTANDIKIQALADTLMDILRAELSPGEGMYVLCMCVLTIYLETGKTLTVDEFMAKFRASFVDLIAMNQGPTETRQ